MLDARYWMLDARHWMLDARHWMLDARHWMIETHAVKMVELPTLIWVIATE
ncbi:MAG: hypothetical protein JRF72_20270 [Deltaproteobacteria bacterium]|nr:hypothetical protein [Deltaproteobacteria bacterium]